MAFAKGRRLSPSVPSPAALTQCPPDVPEPSAVTARVALVRGHGCPGADRLQIRGRAGGREPRSRIRAVCSGIRAQFSPGTAQEPRSASLSSPGLRFCFKGLGRLGAGGCCGMRGCFAGAVQQTEPNVGLEGWEGFRNAPKFCSHL